MKKIVIAASAAIILCIGILAGCAETHTDQTQTSPAVGQSPDAAKHQIVCATFPAYDWTLQVLGDRATGFDIAYLMDSGVDLHNYRPTVEDMTRIADADLFVYVGGESDEWAEAAVTAAGGQGLHTVNMLETIGDAAVEEEVVEGMQAEDEDGGEAEGATENADGEPEGTLVDSEDAGEGDAPEYDEHVWLSLRNAQVLVDAIASALSDIDPDGAATYTANANAYNAQLDDLDNRYARMVNAAAGHTIVFADRFPFRYLADDYGLTYYAAFVGCSAETEASFETVAFLANKLNELDLESVLVIEGSDQKIAQTVIQTAGDADRQILVMDSLQSVDASDIAANKTYLAAMEANLATLEAALA